MRLEFRRSSHLEDWASNRTPGGAHRLPLRIGPAYSKSRLPHPEDPRQLDGTNLSQRAGNRPRSSQRLQTPASQAPDPVEPPSRTDRRLPQRRPPTRKAPEAPLPWSPSARPEHTGSGSIRLRVGRESWRGRHCGLNRHGRKMFVATRGEPAAPRRLF